MPSQPPETAPTPPARRRTQEERRTATRALLLDATIDCLVEYGYASTTTTRVVEHAGVSRGAQVHHFPTKAALVTEAMAHLGRKRIADAREQLSKLPEGPRRVEAGIDMLWEIHTGPMFQAVLELWVAARTDPELRRHLFAFERVFNREIAQVMPELFGDVDREFRELIETTMAAMRGLALLKCVDDRPGQVDALWATTRRQLRRLLQDQ